MPLRPPRLPRPARPPRPPRPARPPRARRAIDPRPALALALALALTSAAALAGCNFQKLVADNMAGSLQDTQAAFNREESPRQAREASPALLSMLDGFVVASPRNQDLLLAGAEMNASAAFVFFESEDEAWARACYRKALDYARRGLAEEDEDLARVLFEGSESELRPALAAIEPGDERIPALFWCGFAWGGLTNVSKTDQRLVAELPKVVLLMERLAEIAPDFRFAGPHLFLAVYHSSRGAAVGGDAKAAERHFEEVFRRTERRLLLPFVLYAERYCVNLLGPKDAAQGRAAFTAALRHVLDTPLDAYPEERLQNAIAKEWAEALLPELDDLIFPPLD